MKIAHGTQLCYCTNVSPAAGLVELLIFLGQTVVPLRKRLHVMGPFGIGLRLSAQQADLLQDDRNLDRLADVLGAHGLYVVTMNGFVFGDFHGGVIKDNVFAVDWTDSRRVSYTSKLIHILSRLMRTDMAGISTVPLSFKSWQPKNRDEVLTAASLNLAGLLPALDEHYAETGKVIHIDLEPEPNGLVENARELVEFFESYLLGSARATLGHRAVSHSEVEDITRRHIRVCYDVCHQWVEYEGAANFLRTISAAGIELGKVQLSSAIGVPYKVLKRRDLLRNSLFPFADQQYLHQVLTRHHSAIEYQGDLADVLRTGAGPAEEWRIHYHLPLFVRNLGPLETGFNEVINVLDYVKGRAITAPLEIETYSWEVLPEYLKTDLLDSMEAEYNVVLEYLESGNTEFSVMEGLRQ